MDRDTEVMARRRARAVRGILSAVLAVVVSACAHAVGGDSVGVVGLLLALALAVPVCIAVASARFSLLRLVISVAVSQVALHLLFGIGAGASAPRGAMDMSTMSDAPSVMAVTSHASAMPMSPWMWLMHLCAAIVTIAAIRKGERLIAAIASLTLGRILRAFTVPALPHVPSVAPRADTPAPVRAAFLLSGLRHRGPPALAASA